MGAMRSGKTASSVVVGLGLIAAAIGIGWGRVSLPWAASADASATVAQPAARITPLPRPRGRAIA